MKMYQLPRKIRRPEDKIKAKIRAYLEQKGWLVVSMHGNLFQRGVPDLYIAHKSFGTRWVEVKLPKMRGSKFTPAQIDMFPKFTSHGAGIWILTAANADEYDLLFRPPNWAQFLSLR